MKTVVIALLIALVFFFSCNTSTPVANVPGPFNTDSLKTEQFTIDINKDTLLRTLNGAWIKIAKGSLIADNDKVVLEVKEAYSMAQIVQAGLLTQSNGQPLSSGGMIWVNAAAGQKVTLSKPIKIAIPTDNLDKNMQLYKGEKKADSTIDWTDPTALKENPQLTNIEKGAILFQKKCASCHGIGKEGSGPDLANILKRIPGPIHSEVSQALIHQFKRVNTPYTVNESTTDSIQKVYDYDHQWSDPYVCNLISLFGNKEVDMSDDCNKYPEEWMNIYAYIENESNKKNLPFPRHAYLNASADSCRLYEKLKNELSNKKYYEQLKRQKLVNENGPLVDRKPDPTWQQRDDITPPPDFDEKVKPNYYGATYYQFTIESFGWYNIDMLLNKTDGVKQSELFVRIVGAYRQKIKIYLIIPSAKVYGEGGPSEKNADEYAFFKKNGSIPLPQNAKAYILAVTETETSIAYALKEFSTTEKQQIEVSLQAATKQSFTKVIESIGADKLSIAVKDSKNAEAIKQADKSIKQLEEELKQSENVKPKRCDCNCGAQAPVVAEKADTLKK